MWAVHPRTQCALHTWPVLQIVGKAQEAVSCRSRSADRQISFTIRPTQPPYRSNSGFPAKCGENAARPTRRVANGPRHRVAESPRIAPASIPDAPVARRRNRYRRFMRASAPFRPARPAASDGHGIRFAPSRPHNPSPVPPASSQPNAEAKRRSPTVAAKQTQLTLVERTPRFLQHGTSSDAHAKSP